MANYPVAGLETVAQFAVRANVSGPTILRLIAKLGFDSYPDFQQALRDELELRLQTPLAKAMPESGHPPQGDFLSTYTRAIIENIEASIADLPRAEFEAAVTLACRSTPAHPPSGRPLHVQPCDPSLPPPA